MLRPTLTTLFFAVIFAFLQTARAQVTSIFLSGSSSWLEESRQISFDVATPSHQELLTVEYRVLSGTAEDGRDFIGSSGTLTFQPSESYKAKAITVQLLDDRDFEGSEYFYIELFNASPAYPISPKAAITIIDDDFGYLPEVTASTNENAGFFNIPIYRRGDIDFPSSVEAYLEPGTAQPGVDYVDETFTVDFGPKETVKNIKVQLINNTIEDGDRWFRVHLRNPTQGIPIGVPIADAIIRDNELGYAFRTQPGASQLALYEGGPERLILERRGDYDISSIATVKATPTPTNVFNWWLTPPAEANVDFIGSDFQIQFAPGQKSAEVPLVIVNDAIPESPEWIHLQYTTNVATAGLGEQILAIHDNEFNPLPVTALCLGFELALLPLTPLRDGKFLAVTGNEAGGYNYKIYRFTETGQLDTNFTAIIPNGRPLKIVEGTDGKYTIKVWRDIEEGLQRFQADGRPDPLFQQLTQRYVNDFEVTADGKIYVTGPLRRLNNDASIDTTFTPPELEGGDLFLDSAQNVYVRGDFSWQRFNPFGALDPNFSHSDNDSLYEVGGVIYRYNFGVLERLTDTGALDPSFTPIDAPVIQAGANGKLYAFRAAGNEVSVQRFNSNGTPDTTYLRGTLDLPLDTIGFSMLENGRAALATVQSDIPSLNGTPLNCDDRTRAVAHINLEPAPQRFLLELNKNTLLERDTGEPKMLSFIRTGDNQSAAAIHYRIRPGSALPGEHYSIPSEGDIAMEPGISRALLPITILDNSKPESDRSFFVDLLGEDGSVLSTSEITIRNDDIGLQFLSHQGNSWRIVATGCEYPTVILMRSSDLINWEFIGGAPAGIPIDIEMTGNRGFLRAYGDPAYPGY